MKKILLPLILLILGLGLGGGAAFATVTFLLPKHEKGAEKPNEAEPHFVDGGKILAPLVFSDGRLAGYVQFEIQLDVPADQESFVTARLPLLMHAINMRTFKAPLASGPDGQLPDVGQFRKLAQEAADEAFGKEIVHRVVVTAATPA